jgi:serine/threonine protein kinase
MSASAPTVQPAVFEDILGKRHQANAPNGELLEVLELRDAFTTDAFELALRTRIAALSDFHTTWFARVRTVQRINRNGSKIFVVYDCVPGVRLSTVLAARRAAEPLELNATLYLIRQLAAAIALLHEKRPGVAHGAISGERIIITPTRGSWWPTTSWAPRWNSCATRRRATGRSCTSRFRTAMPRSISASM